MTLKEGDPILADMARKEALKNAPVSDSIARFLLAHGNTEERSVWHSKSFKLEGGRRVHIGMASLNGFKTLEEIKANGNQNDVLEVSIGSPREGVVGYNIRERMDENEVTGYRVKTGPDSWFDLIGVFEQDAGHLQYQLLKDYGKILSSIVKALNIQQSPQDK